MRTKNIGVVLTDDLMKWRRSRERRVMAVGSVTSALIAMTLWVFLPERGTPTEKFAVIAISAFVCILYTATTAQQFKDGDFDDMRRTGKSRSKGI